MRFLNVCVICIATASAAHISAANAQSRLLWAQPNVQGPFEAYQQGLREAQEQRQREQDYQAEAAYLQGQQRLRILAAEFWQASEERKWALLPQIAEIDPALAAQYQATIPAPSPVTNESATQALYRCNRTDGSVVFTAVPTQGCTVIATMNDQ